MTSVKFRGAFGTEVLLVPPHAVRRLERSEAERVVHDAFARTENAGALHELVSSLSRGSDDADATLIQIVVDMLAHGELLAIELEREISVLPSPFAGGGRSITPLADLANPPHRHRDEPTTPPQSTDFIAVEVLDPQGNPFVGALVVLEYPHGGQEAIVLDGRGALRRDHLPSASWCRVRFLEPPGPPPMTTPAMVGFRITADDVRVTPDHPMSPRLSVGGRHRIIVMPDPHRLAVAVAEDDGTAYPGPLVLIRPDGSEETLRLDRAGVYSTEAVELDGAYRLSFREPRFVEREPGLEPVDNDGEPTCSDDSSRDLILDFHDRISDVDLQLDRDNALRLHRPVVRRPSFGLFPCWRGSALMMPAPWTDGYHPIPVILQAVVFAQRLEDAVICVVGHVASSAAGAAEPPKLGQQRADATAAWIRGDRSVWVAFAEASGTLADVLAYLDYLHRERGWPCSVEAISPQQSPATESSVAAFQQEYCTRFGNTILVDGVCGEETLGAVFDVLRFEWERWLTKYGLSDADVAAASIQYLDGSDVPPDRLRVGTPSESGGLDVLVFERAALAGETPTAELIYGSCAARFSRFEFVREAGGWEYGPYTIVTDVAFGEEVLPETYTLRATDGSFVQNRRLPDEAIDTGLLELRFEDVPCDRSYRLEVEIEGVGLWVLFDGVSYAGLHRLASQSVDDESEE